MIRTLTGDCRVLLPTLAAASIDMVCTSPPYFGLRDYGTAQWEGGEAGCDHRAPDDGGSSTAQKDGRREHAGRFSGPACWRCGARRIDSQIGLEASPDAYVAEMVAVFREVRRVLKDDGTVWLNLGDSYAGYHGNKNAEVPTSATNGWTNGTNENLRTSTANRNGVKAKDLLMIPARVALALQADGWWLRSHIIWAKPSPMPESVTDRPTSAHESVFLLAKRERYFYDAEAVKEAGSANSHGGAPIEGGPKQAELGQQVGGRMGIPSRDAGRNLRNVWTIASAPFAEAHFATFPPALAERCIKAGCRVGGTVLDPFSGAGTVGLVADRLGRDAILIDLNPAYVDMARERIVGDAPLFVELEAAP